ncbi:hypothetical protein [Synechococcus lacustris]|uniref:hypothetical protein n=1 Tax=Synechococcus lacustris TaxID=2116544 RepID=UPI0020CFA446|nr:hypothetical protein [Synechococcus lacustris]MCP9814743.1 hypothetical protein [Synechococcus lacustris L1E-Slac]
MDHAEAIPLGRLLQQGSPKMQSWRPVAVGVAVRVLVQLHIPRPVPLLLHRCPIRRSNAS